MNHSASVQLSLQAIVLGLLLSMVLAAANTYLGLFAGMTISASIPAAVLAMAVLRALGRQHVLETNIVQTAASAGESLAAGAIFTFPALILLNYWHVFDYLWVTVIAAIGGLLGVLFTIPLRRALVVEHPLPFPEGTATAEVIKLGDGAARGAKELMGAAVAGAVVKVASTGLNLWPSAAAVSGFLGRSPVFLGLSLSPALLGVGYIVGLEVAVLVLAGGMTAWLVAIPIYAQFGLEPVALELLRAETGSAAALAAQLWSTKIRYLGVGAMLVGGLWALVSLFPSLYRSMRNHSAGDDTALPHDRDTPMPVALSLALILLLPLFLLYQSIVPWIGVAIAMTVIMVVAGFLFSAVAAYMAGLVGSSHNPVSGVTIATLLLASLLLWWMLGGDSAVGPAAAILIGAVVCCAAAVGGDNMQDLKAGFLVGATPWKQQVAQAVGVLSAALVMAPVLNLLLQAYGFGPATADQPNALSAPQATLMASVAAGVFGQNLPWGLVVWGGAIGLVVIVMDLVLQCRGVGFRLPVLPVAVGIYLPLELSTTIALGGLMAYLAGTRRDRLPHRTGILIAAGLVTGEALVGILLAVPIVVTGRSDWLAAPFQLPAAELIGVLILLGMGGWLVRAATPESDAD